MSSCGHGPSVRSVLCYPSARSTRRGLHRVSCLPPRFQPRVTLAARPFGDFGEAGHAVHVSRSRSREMKPLPGTEGQRIATVS